MEVGIGATVVIGAGVCGLAAARALVDAGRQVLVLERSSRVGGRCASRPVGEVLVDHGVSWLHGSDPAFLRATSDARCGPALTGWPRRVRGDGPACNPRALTAAEQRFALIDGINAFPRALAQGLTVRHGCTVTALARHAHGWTLSCADGASLEAASLVLAVAPEQAARLLATLPEDRDVRAARFLVGRAGTVACLAVLAAYDRAPRSVGFDVWRPGGDAPLALVADDSTKRADPRHLALLLQATPAWSRRWLDAPPAQWGPMLLEAAAAALGDWVCTPSVQLTQRWRYARVEPVHALRAPLRLGSGGAAGVVAGGGFHDGAGVQGAFLAGQAAARGLLAMEA